MAQPKKKSLQDVLRERRAAAPLLSARELREREAARRREEVEREAARVVARWRAERTAVDADGKLGPAVYAAVFASSRPAYLASKHWSRRSSAQRKAMPACEVARCGKSEGLHAHLLNHDALGEEVAGRDLDHALRGLPAPRGEARAGPWPAGDAGRAAGARPGEAALRPGRDRRAESEAQPSARHERARSTDCQ